MGPRIRGAFGGWPRLDPAEVDLFVHWGRLSRDSRGWPQPGRLWRPRLGNHMLALSDWRSLADTSWGWPRRALFSSFLSRPTWMALRDLSLLLSGRQVSGVAPTGPGRQVSGVAPTGRQSLGGLTLSRCHLRWTLFGGSPNWTCFSSRFGGWPRLDLETRSGGGPHRSSAFRGWHQLGRLWRPRRGNHMLALSDWHSLAGTFPGVGPLVSFQLLPGQPNLDGSFRPCLAAF